VTFFLAFLVTGLVLGCIYALTASGLVVTYMTSGIFNFAHGAIGMIAAFGYWQLSVEWGLPVPVSLFLVLFVLAPLLGAAIERVLIRPIQGASADLSIVITLGLLLFLIGVANAVWKPTQARILRPFFDGHQVQVGALSVTYNQIVVVVVALAVAGGLRLLFSRTRIGIAMRGVVDDPDLAAMAGCSPARVQMLSWSLGASLASLAGILLAPLVNLDILTLTLLVINGYAAALVGRLKSLPMTALGALALGLLVNAAKIYGPDASKIWQPLGEVIRDYQGVIPMVFLFLVLVFLPPARLRTSAAMTVRTPTVPGLKQSLAVGTALVVAMVVLSTQLSASGFATGGKVFALAITLLSLVLLTGYSGQISLCQFAFVGLGGYAMGTWGGGSLLGLVAAVALAAAAGAAVALPTLKLRGLYLALATFAFAVAMDKAFFDKQFGNGGSLDVPRVRIPGIPTQSDQAFFLLLVVTFVVCAVGVLAIRRGRFGRQLTALNDSPAACATLGLNINYTKLAVFAASAGLAGLSGALFGGLRGSIGPNDVVALASLLLLLTLRIGGVNTVTGALFGALTVAMFPLLQDRVPQLPALAYLLTGLAAVSIGRDPNGVGGQVSQLGERLRAAYALRGRSQPPLGSSRAPQVEDQTELEEARLAGVPG
jgi:branched-chain amino acid transport system permease protein